MIGRRALLSLLAAVPLADAARRSVNTAEASSMLDKMEGVDEFGGFDAPEQEEWDPDDYDPFQLYELVAGGPRLSYRKGRPGPNITSKKSWSPVFKETVFLWEYKEQMRIYKAIHRNAEFRKMLGRMVGLETRGQRSRQMGMPVPMSTVNF